VCISGSHGIMVVAGIPAVISYTNQLLLPFDAGVKEFSSSCD